MAEWSDHITVERITKETLPDVRWLKYRLRRQDELEIKATDTNLEWECKIVCVNRYCMNLLYAPYWGKQR